MNKNLPLPDAHLPDIPQRPESVHGRGLWQAAQLLLISRLLCSELYSSWDSHVFVLAAFSPESDRYPLLQEQLADLNLLPVSVWKSTSLLISFPICISHLSLEAKRIQKTLKFLLLQIISSGL